MNKEEKEEKRQDLLIEMMERQALALEAIAEILTKMRYEV